MYSRSYHKSPCANIWLKKKCRDGKPPTSPTKYWLQQLICREAIFVRWIKVNRLSYEWDGHIKHLKTKQIHILYINIYRVSIVQQKQLIPKQQIAWMAGNSSSIGVFLLATTFCHQNICQDLRKKVRFEENFFNFLRISEVSLKLAGVGRYDCHSCDILASLFDGLW